MHIDDECSLLLHQITFTSNDRNSNRHSWKKNGRQVNSTKFRIDIMGLCTSYRCLPISLKYYRWMNQTQKLIPTFYSSSNETSMYERHFYWTIQWLNNIHIHIFFLANASEFSLTLSIEAARMDAILLIIMGIRCHLLTHYNFSITSRFIHPIYSIKWNKKKEEEEVKRFILFVHSFFTIWSVKHRKINLFSNEKSISFHPQKKNNLNNSAFS